MEMITDLRQKHLAGWTKALRELKPDDMKAITELPEVEFDGVTVKAAIMAGWFADIEKPEAVDDMKASAISKLSGEIWKAFNEARKPDPN